MMKMFNTFPQDILLAFFAFWKILLQSGWFISLKHSLTIYSPMPSGNGSFIDVPLASNWLLFWIDIFKSLNLNSSYPLNETSLEIWSYQFLIYIIFLK